MGTIALIMAAQPWRVEHVMVDIWQTEMTIFINQIRTVDIYNQFFTIGEGVDSVGGQLQTMEYK